jgi:hypothetical protein
MMLLVCFHVRPGNETISIAMEEEEDLGPAWERCDEWDAWPIGGLPWVQGSASLAAP